MDNKKIFRYKLSGSRSGFTLVELLLSLGVASILLAVIMSMSVSSQQLFALGSVFSDIHAEVRISMDYMKRDIMGATRMMNSYGGYTTTSSSIILEIPSVDVNGNVIDINNDFDYITYALNSGDPTQLDRIIDASASSSRADETQIFARNVDTLLFSSGGTVLSSIGDVSGLTQVDITLILLKAVPGNSDPLQETLSSKVKLRNN